VPSPSRRRKADRLLDAFHHACDCGDIEPAGKIFERLEQEVKKPPPPGMIERRAPVSLRGPHERLANLVLHRVVNDWQL
jgi:hypothetical protein